MINRILRYNNYILKEMSINDDIIKKYDNALKNIQDYKLTSSYMNDIILNLKNEIVDDIKIKKYSDDSTYLIYKIKYNKKCEDYIEILNDILLNSENTEVYDNYLSLIFADKNNVGFNTEIEIEKNNMNRIHVPIGLPYILKGIGIGKKIYKLLIYELGYITSHYKDRTIDSLYVWDSIRKDKEIYTFIKNESIIGISPKLNFSEIEKILSKFYKNITDEVIIMDDDFKDTYNKEIVKSETLDRILNLEVRQIIEERKLFNKFLEKRDQ